MCDLDLECTKIKEEQAEDSGASNTYGLMLHRVRAHIPVGERAELGCAHLLSHTFTESFYVTEKHRRCDSKPRPAVMNMRCSAHTPAHAQPSYTSTDVVEL